MSLMGGDNALGSRQWSNQMCCEIEEDGLKTLICKVHTLKSKVVHKCHIVRSMPIFKGAVKIFSEIAAIS